MQHTSAPTITRDGTRIGGERRHANRPSDRAPWHFGLISAVTARGHMRLMIIGKGSVNAAVFIEFVTEFLKRPIKNGRREIVSIVGRG